MKILLKTDRELVLEYRPILFVGAFAAVSLYIFSWGLSDLFSGGDAWMLQLLVAGLFMGVTLLMVERSRLSMDARAGSVVFRRVSMFRNAHQIYTLQEISGFEIEKNSNRDGDAHRITMIIAEGEANGRYPLTAGYYSWLDKSIATMANDWLRKAKENAPAQTANSAAATLLPSDKSTL